MLKNFWANYNGFSVLMAKLFWRENKNSIVYKFSLEVSAKKFRHVSKSETSLN